MKNLIALIVVLLPLMLMQSQVVSQMPPPSSLEPGVSQELAKWRAERYSDVRYKLNLTLEKMSPVLKGTMEIRVTVGAGTLLSPSAQRAETTSIILDWRKIRGHEERSTISNVTINGRSVDTLVRMSVASTRTGSGDSENSTGNETFAGGTGDADKSVRAPFEEHNEHLIFRDGVVAGENVIKLDFTSPILTSGSAITRYIDKEDGNEYIYSLFVPSDASTAFPVFDQPDLKAKFDLLVSAPTDWKIVSNTLGRNNNIWGDLGDPLPPKHLRLTAFYQTKPISTYVFAFAAGPFEKFSDSVSSPHVSKGSVLTKDNVTVQDTGGNLSGSEGVKNAEFGVRNAEKKNILPTGRVSASQTIYVRKSQAEKFKPHAAEVFRLNRESVKFFEEYFDYKFPFPKYDLVLIPEFPFGGMEHAGATFLRESSIIFPQEPTLNDRVSRAILIFHEAAHQWFGDTVTMKWFDDLWLKEGFANFAAYKALEKIMPEANAWKVFYERIKQGAYATDSTKGTTPIYQEIKNLSAAKSAYGNIVYNKAPAFLRQAEFYLGEEKFQTAVRSFLKKHEFGNAGWEDLVTHFIAASPASEGRPYWNELTTERKKRIEDGKAQYMREWANYWVTHGGVAVIKAGLTEGHYERQVPSPPGSWASVSGMAPALGLTLSPEYENSRWGNSIKVLFRYGAENEITETYASGNPWTEQLPRLFNKEDKFDSNHPWPDLIFPNYGDYGYGIFLLDSKSREYVLKNIQKEKDPFLRSMMWGALWDSVREGELDPREYVELVVRVLSTGFSRQPPKGGTHNEGGTLNEGEDESTTALLLNRVGTAMNYYMSEPPPLGGGQSGSSRNWPAANATGSDLRTRVEDMLIERMQNSPTLGQRITYYRAFLNVAASENARMVLKRMLKSEPPASAGGQSGNSPNRPDAYAAGSDNTLPLKTKDKFDIVTRLLILGDADAQRLLTELEKTETTDDAKRYAYAARAGIATAENKAKYWNDFVNNKEISESWIEAAFGPWNSNRHSQLTLPYLQKALQELPNHKRNRKIFFVNGWLGSFIGGQRSEEALNIINKFLADNPKLDNDLRLKILENSDIIERAVKIRQKFNR